MSALMVIFDRLLGAITLLSISYHSCLYDSWIAKDC